MGAAGDATLMGPPSGALRPEQLRLLRLSARVSFGFLLFLVAAVALLYLGRDAHSFASDRELSNYFAYCQDLEVALAVLVFLLGVSFVTPAKAVARIGPRMVPLIALAVFLACYAGTHWVFGRFDLSLDEVMADFDMHIIRHGLLFAPIAPEWRGLRDALQPLFMLKVAGAEVWSSAYLPGNAAIRALFDAMGDASLTGPVEAAASVLLIYGIAAKLRPGDRIFALVATLLFATSSQFLVTAMTAYSMTAHLAFNLAWLWLVLHDRWWSRIGALLATLVATGLHQLPFHPLFVAPFLLWLAYERRWWLVLLYGGGVAAAALLCTAYWPVALAWSGVEPQAASAVGGGYLVDRVMAMVMSAFVFVSVVFTVDNLLRLITWQNPLLWPLFVVAAATLRRQPPIAWAMLGGIVLMFAAMLVLMPYQGHGWGYRYLHGLLGNFALLGAYGWRTVRDEDEGVTGIPRLHLIAVLMSLLLLPVRGLQAHAFAAPYQRADRAIARLDADIVIIDPAIRWYSQDMIRNDPFLTNRPVRVGPTSAVVRHAAELCARYRVRIVDQNSPELAGLRSTGSPQAVEQAERRVAFLRRAGCDQRAPKPVRTVRIVRATIRTSTQNEKFLM